MRIVAQYIMCERITNFNAKFQSLRKVPIARRHKAKIAINKLRISLPLQYRFGPNMYLNMYLFLEDMMNERKPSIGAKDRVFKKRKEAKISILASMDSRFP